ncbi:MAG: hypothetical protein ACK5IP_23710 [Paracoccus sp. (in: a-proteobacteria)]
MTDRTGRQRKDAASAILFPLLFDIDGYLKGYVGGLVVVIDDWTFAYRPPSFRAMMVVSASLFVGLARVR